MFNREAAGKARDRLKKAIATCNEKQSAVQKLSVDLYKKRKSSSKTVIEKVEQFINEIADHPKKLDRSFAEYTVAFKKFTGVEKAIEQQLTDVAIRSGAGAGVGIAAGATTALLGPTAAMAVATTFGTASTGTAIAALSGAAANSAALAWLGGGALVAGGGGVSAGGALLALAGPVGWGAAALAAAGGAAYFSFANGKVVAEANKKVVEVEQATATMALSLNKIQYLLTLTREHSTGLTRLMTRLRRDLPSSYTDFSDKQLRDVGAVVNHVRALSKLLNQTLEEVAIPGAETSEPELTANGAWPFAASA